MAEWYEIRKIWNWWRWEDDHKSPPARYSRKEALIRTFNSCVLYPLRDIYCRVWIFCSRLNWKYNRFGKMYRMRKQIKELEEKLFPEDTEKHNKSVQPTKEPRG